MIWLVYVVRMYVICDQGVISEKRRGVKCGEEGGWCISCYVFGKMWWYGRWCCGMGIVVLWVECCCGIVLFWYGGLDVGGWYLFVFIYV